MEILQIITGQSDVAQGIVIPTGIFLSWSYSGNHLIVAV